MSKTLFFVAIVLALCFCSFTNAAEITLTEESYFEQTVGLHKSGCPKVHTVGSTLNVTEYTRATWYIQEQQVNGYQSLNDLYCVSATYNAGEKRASVPFFSGNVLAVYNYANVGQVNGVKENKLKFNETILCARQPDKKDASQLLVAPCFLPNFFAGNYWILDVGVNENGQYDWAVISGGQPTEKVADGCTTKEKGINGSGLWVMTRARNAAPETVAEAKQALVKQGIATSRLHKVEQDGCNYVGAFVKGNFMGNNAN